eukprot:15472876-Alexandrium_andersonii.AAC.1
MQPLPKHPGPVGHYNLTCGPSVASRPVLRVATRSRSYCRPSRDRTQTPHQEAARAQGDVQCIVTLSPPTTHVQSSVALRCPFLVASDTADGHTSHL